MVKSINFLVLIIIALFAVSCEKDKGLIPTGENQESVANTIFLDGEKGSSDEFSRAVEAALEDSSGIELDWSRESVKPFTRANKILVVPVKNSSDYVMFYKEKGKILYKYLHPLQGQDEDKIFEEMTFQVVNDSKELGTIGQFAGKAAEKIAKIEVRIPDDPCGCEGSGIGEWLKNTWQDFGNWLGGLGGAISNLFNTSSDGRYEGTSSNYFASNGSDGSSTVGNYSGIPNDNIGINYEGGYASTYNNLGELFNYNNNILLDVLPNLSNGGGSKAEWLRDNPDEMINIHFYIDVYGDTKEAKQAADKYYELMQYSLFENEGINLIDYEPDEFLAASTLYEVLRDGYVWGFPDKEEALFYLEMFEKDILPLGITFIPGGIGDAADILLNCNTISWGCAWAVLGVLVPVDELLDIWKKRSQFKAAWRAINSYDDLESAWRLLKNCDKPIRTNTSILDDVRKALQRGTKSVSSVVNHANVSYITSSTVQHIFRGSGSGGVHHISALIADSDTYKIHSRLSMSKGCYRATVYKNGTPMSSIKDFFPDDWDEYKVIEEIKEAWNNKSYVGGNTYDGYASNGKRIRMFIANEGTSSERIISAFPQ
ncbi:EndoU domain-containing protein [Membranihabitans maritimus]|uniref:EndoU domain-containing protein n=1 Tax=Membranihabitans maritimus TaxID=2904244 RepID=UPI001F41EEFC|nr:EndoU domain-containing protein [Membranihabitans maritimus]